MSGQKKNRDVGHCMEGDGMKTSVFISSSYEAAVLAKPDATVEAEYGEKVAKGSVVTLAHHVGEYARCPPPCMVDVPALREGSTIVISHIDLDTVGGCLALMGKKPASETLWEAVGYIDTHGRHHLNNLNEDQQDMLNGLWSWETGRKMPGSQAGKLLDVTRAIEEYIPRLELTIQKDSEMIQNGRVWAKDLQERVDNCLVYESDSIRAFISEGLPCFSSYYSQKVDKIVKATIELDTGSKSITVGFFDGGVHISAKTVVQQLWGLSAGGHQGIAGSPREWNTSGLPLKDLRLELWRAIDFLEHLFAQ